MPFVDAAKNTMLDALTIDLISLHDAYPGTNGLSNELSGGSYARTAATVNAASGGSRSLNADVAIPVPAGDVAFIGFWRDDTTDEFLGWAPNGPASNNPQACYAEATSNEIRLDGHGFSNGDTVIFFPLADALPSPIALGTVYYVISSDADSFEISTTSGGSAVDIAADGDLLLQEIIVETYAQAGTHTVKAGVSVAL